MSSIYVLEPPTRGKVILKTTCGPLDIELWPKEAPKATRNFVQLCLESYYDGTIFHRVIKDFLVQAGDPTGTGTGGESIYGAPFADEFHSRLRFSRRGLVACANAGQANSNNSQFFITLDRCDFLEKKHTIFGKVTGDTIYNLLKIGESETGENDRPVDPPEILAVEVLWDPFDDIVPRNLRKATLEVKAADKEVKQGKKKLNLLSFGEEALQEEQEVSTVKDKFKSSHDVLDDPRLLKSEATAETSTPAEKIDNGEDKRRKDLQSAVREALGSSAMKVKGSDDDDDDDEDEGKFDTKMRQQVLQKRKRFDEPKKSSNSGVNDVQREEKEEAEEDEEEEEEEEKEERRRKEKLVLKKKGLGSEIRAERAAKADADAHLLTPLEQQRQKYKQRKRSNKGREEATWDLLNKFKEKMLQSKAQASEGKKMGSGEDESAADVEFMSHALKFETDPMKRDKMSRNDDLEHYVVHDPLVEKGKEKFNKMQAKMKRRNREWAGRSLT